MIDSVVQGLKSYLNDPASSDYQKGYLACLLDIYVDSMSFAMSEDDLEKLHDMTM